MVVKYVKLITNGVTRRQSKSPSRVLGRAFKSRRWSSSERVQCGTYFDVPRTNTYCGEAGGMLPGSEIKRLVKLLSIGE
jgi:hypothetical protein